MWHLAFSISALIIDLGAMNFDYFQLCEYELEMHSVLRIIYIMRIILQETIILQDKIIFLHKLSKMHTIFPRVSDFLHTWNETVYFNKLD